MTPQSYIALQSSDEQLIIRNLVAIIEEEVQEVVSKMSYGIICFWHYYMLVGIGAKKKGCISFYTMRNELLEEMKHELQEIKWKGSTIHLYPGEVIPEKIIRKIVRQRIKENDKTYNVQKIGK